MKLIDNIKQFLYGESPVITDRTKFRCMTCGHEFDAPAVPETACILIDRMGVPLTVMCTKCGNTCEVL